MHMDKSSLEGTLQVLSDIITKTLKLSGDSLEKHSIILCAGDQLTMSLLDKVRLITGVYYNSNLKNRLLHLSMMIRSWSIMWDATQKANLAFSMSRLPEIR
jgi:hypothetical protein